METIKQTLHDAMKIMLIYWFALAALAAMVNLCSCSSSKKVTKTDIVEHTDAAFQQTRSLDLNIAKLVSSQDSTWIRIVFFDTNLPVLDNGLPPVKAIAEGGSLKQKDEQTDTSIQRNDTTSIQENNNIEHHNDETIEKDTKWFTDWKFYFYGFLAIALALYLIYLKFK